MTPNLGQIDAKLAAARTRLILEQPFIGALVMHLPLRPADPRWCQTTATDARAIHYNPEYIAGLDLRQTQFVLAHEALHCALAHFARRSHRVKRRWDVACDHAVNILLADEGLKPPPGALLNSTWRGLSAEEIYPLIAADTEERPLDLHAFDGDSDGLPRLGLGDARPGALQERPAASRAGVGFLPESELAAESASMTSSGGLERGMEQASPMAGVAVPPAGEDLATLWKTRLAAAAQQAARAGRLSESWLRALDHLIQPQLPWRALLARFLASAARDDYSFQRPPRREGEALLPRLASSGIELVVALDTSGSIGDEDLLEFASEVDALKGQVRARVTLHACDQALDPKGPWLFENWEPVVMPRDLKGGGGTRFTPVFEWIEREGLRPDLLVYFTDGEGEFPEREPGYPVVWLVKGRAPVPWGERVQLN
ncbi:MAG TPA: VWA-like domain-containing protein [Burkholderiales bacterium]|nr:VWA-like domain-containing protein [Burkholderiales bacterium]